MSLPWSETCDCGCDQPLDSCGTSRYLRGHDMKHLANLLHDVTGRTTRPEQAQVIWQMDEDLKTAAEALVELHMYLSSEKFHLDPTVQVRDVMNRLSAATTALAGYRENEHG